MRMWPMRHVVFLCPFPAIICGFHSLPSSWRHDVLSSWRLFLIGRYYRPLFHFLRETSVPRKKVHFYLHISFFCCTFAPAKVSKTRIVMQTDVQHPSNEAPITTEVVGSGNVQKKYYTADEAIAFLEPRIRAMFQWKRLFTPNKLCYNLRKV